MLSTKRLLLNTPVCDFACSHQKFKIRRKSVEIFRRFLEIFELATVALTCSLVWFDVTGLGAGEEILSTSPRAAGSFCSIPPYPRASLAHPEAAPPRGAAPVPKPLGSLRPGPRLKAICGWSAGPGRLRPITLSYTLSPRYPPRSPCHLLIFPSARKSGHMRQQRLPAQFKSLHRRRQSRASRWTARPILSSEKGEMLKISWKFLECFSILHSFLKCGHIKKILATERTLEWISRHSWVIAVPKLAHRIFPKRFTEISYAYKIAIIQLSI